MGQINTGTFDNVHPEDIEHLTRSIKEFSLHLAPFDIVYRVKYEENKEYHTIHSIGRFQPTDDGSDLALLTYIDVSDSGSASRHTSTSNRRFPSMLQTYTHRYFI